jgi:uncharacterized protein (DUF2141 family)
MNKFFIFFFSLILISNCSFSQLKLDVEIIDIRNNTGNIMLQLFDKNEKIVTQEKSPVKDYKCSFSFTNLKPGKFAARYYHDENLNGKMETNLVGKPTEGYGFSNNMIGKFGPPPFEKWLFEINGDKKIVLKPTYKIYL